MPWWPTEDEDHTSTCSTFLVQTKMKNRQGEGLLIDPGAHDDLIGDEWVRRFTEEAAMSGQPTPIDHQLKDPVNVGGVGKGRQETTRGVRCSIGVEGNMEIYQAPVLQNSGVPALLGIKTLKQRRAIIDCFTGKMFLVGQGGYKLSLSPGSRSLDLYESHSGHWLLPCTDWPGTSTHQCSDMTTPPSNSNLESDVREFLAERRDNDNN